MLNFLRRLFGGGERSHTAATPLPSPPAPPADDEAAEQYLEKVQAKVAKLAEDFAEGSLNRAQFQDLYAHYQREIRTVEQVIESKQGDWRAATTEGQSLLIRRRKLARAEGYAIYENDSGMPLSTLGKFELEPELIVPMLSSYRTATAEMFGGGLRSTGIDNGRWLCFVAGQHTTLMALFTVEPAPKQLEYLGQLHRTFESANRKTLSAPPVNPDVLIYPHEHYLGAWRGA
ncbi:MAG: hypothetical protein ACT4QE_07030 [Anaerolineales bacterium]